MGYVPCPFFQVRLQPCGAPIKTAPSIRTLETTWELILVESDIGSFYKKLPEPLKFRKNNFNSHFTFEYKHILSLSAECAC
jgi:hypothetical protein